MCSIRKFLFDLLIIQVLYASAVAKMDDPTVETSIIAGNSRTDQVATWERNLKDDYVREDDVCKNKRGRFEKCDESKFPRCRRGIEICLNRRPMRGRYYDDAKIHPRFYIDYNLVVCAPVKGFNCDRCETAKNAFTATFCRKTNHCMLKDNWRKYCSDKENSAASKIKRKEKREKRKRMEERRKRREKKLARRQKEREAEAKAKREREAEIQAEQEREAEVQAVPQKQENGDESKDMEAEARMDDP